MEPEERLVAVLNSIAVKSKLELIMTLKAIMEDKKAKANIGSKDSVWGGLTPLEAIKIQAKWRIER